MLAVRFFSWTCRVTMNPFQALGNNSVLPDSPPYEAKEAISDARDAILRLRLEHSDTSSNSPAEAVQSGFRVLLDPRLTYVWNLTLTQKVKSQ